MKSVPTYNKTYKISLRLLHDESRARNERNNQAN